MNRKKIVAGNWKMNLTKIEAVDLAKDIEQDCLNETAVEVFLFAPSVYLDALMNLKTEQVAIGAQNFYPTESGAFTGEISIIHLNDLKVGATLIGHSERRIIFGENEAFLKQKVDAALAAGLRVFFCCGEPLEIREANDQNEYVEKQLRASLLHLTEEQLQQVVIAYEPVWAIGTGRTASKEQANEMHAFIRALIAKTHQQSAADAIQILYGGSCNAKNAHELFSMPDIDGGLIGGASLKGSDFKTIIEAAR